VTAEDRLNAGITRMALPASYAPKSKYRVF